MSTNVDPRRSIAAWLEAEAPHGAPDRLIAASRERVRTTRQRPVWWPARRASDMNSYAKLAIAAAAVLVVAVAGYNLLPTRNGVAGVPSPSPSASPAPPGPAKDGTLQPGRYTAPIAGAGTVDFTVPAGWSWNSEYSIITTGDPSDEIAIALWSSEGLQVYTDPCQWSGAEPKPATGPTAQDLAEGLAAQPMRNGSTPIRRNAPGPDASDQWTGWLVELTVPDAIDFGTCSNGEFRSWGPSAQARYHQGPGQRDTVWAIDVGETRVVIDGTFLPSAPDTAKAAIDSVMDSMVFSTD